MGRLPKNLLLMLRFPKALFLVLLFSSCTLMVILMILLVIFLLSMLMILLSTLSVIELLIYGNSFSWLWNVNLAHKKLDLHSNWLRDYSAKKLILFERSNNVVLLMKKCMALFLMKNYLLQYCIFPS